MIRAEVGGTILLSAISQTGNTALFPRVAVLDRLGAHISGSPFTLNHRVLSLYQLEIPSPSEGKYSLIKTFYDDPIAVTPTVSEDRQGDDLDVSLPESEAHVVFAYDEVGETLRASAWLDRSGETVTGATSASVDLRDEAGAVIASMSSVAPDPNNGTFNISQAGILLADNRTYNARITVTDALGAFSTVRSFTTVA